MDAELFDGLIDAALKEDMPRGGHHLREHQSPPIPFPGPDFWPRKRVSSPGSIWPAGSSRRSIRAFLLPRRFEDGRSFGPGDVLARLEGSSISLLKGERTALNFLQRMSGIATKTREFVRALEGTKTRVLDTRKTTPGLRSLEKYAVRMGGGVNHRLSLSDMVLIKDNHLEIIGSVSEAVRRARAGIAPGIMIEVEVTGFEGAREALESGADMIMLDNMPLEKMKEVVDWIGGRVPVEVSGKITVESARRIAAFGVDFISVGALTHSFRSIDISLEFEGRRRKMKDEARTFDVLILGCGIAGASAALAAAKGGLRVAVVTKAANPEESNTFYAQGGIVSLGNHDHPESLKEDIIEAGDGISNPEAVDILAEEAKGLVDEDPHRRAQDPVLALRARRAGLCPGGRPLPPPHPPRPGLDRPDHRGKVHPGSEETPDDHVLHGSHGGRPPHRSPPPEGPHRLLP